MATITLVYNIGFGLVDPTPYLAQFAVIDISDVIEYLQMSITSDNTVVAPPGLVRTIVLATNSESDLSFPDDVTKIQATRNLFTGTFAQGPVPTAVEAETPVVT